MKKKGNKKMPPRQRGNHNLIPTGLSRGVDGVTESSHEKEPITPSLNLSVYTRREIGSETTDNLSEDNPVKNAYCASTHTYPCIYDLAR